MLAANVKMNTCLQKKKYKEINKQQAGSFWHHNLDVGNLRIVIVTDIYSLGI